MKTTTKLLIISALSLCIASCSFKGERTHYEAPDLSFTVSYIGPEMEDIQPTEKYTDYGENPFIKTSEQPVSTFSVDADGASYANMRRFVNLGQKPPKESVRIEEYINYFTFDYPEPSGDENISLDTEISDCPWNKEHQLLRIGIKGKTIAQQNLPASNYVFLIDVSGSMNSADKLGILKKGFNMMLDQLGDQDRIAIVTYAGSAGVALPSTHCDEKDKIRKAIDKLHAAGSTAGAAGIVTAYEIASKNFIPGGNNRIIIGTDGDYNVGPVSTEELVEIIEKEREKGIFLTVLGVGSGNLNDAMMEQLANKGNGTYEYIDNVNQLKKVFIHEKSKFYTIAKDCKIQLTFNPNVDSYRLIGYENRIMNEEDFKDDKKDAGEIGIGQTITALYQIVPKNTKASSNYAKLDVRYKKPDQETSIPLSKEILYTRQTIENASQNMRFCAAVAAFGMLMKDSEYKGTINNQMIMDLAKTSTSFDPNGYRKEFLELVNKVD